LFCLLAGNLGRSSSASAQVLDRVLAVVSGQVILASDVRAFLDLGLHERGLWDVSEQDPAAREAAALNRLIERRLALDEVNRYRQALPPPARVERDVAVVRARFADADAFNRLLAAVGIELDDLRQILRDDLRIEAHVTERFGGAGRLTEAELRVYYEANRARFVVAGLPAPFEAVRDEIRDRLWTVRRAELVEGWIAGRLRRGEVMRVDR
jgi:peptidyl-prolyl cis-trans isomerase SurA